MPRAVVDAMSDEEYARYLREMYDHAWKPLEDMSHEEHHRFAFELYEAVRSEDCLHTVPLGASDIFGPNPGDEIRYGPWRPTDCARVLRRWHDEGLLHLFGYPDGVPARLSPSDAEALLAHPDRWRRSAEPNDTIHLGTTDAGVAAPEADWLALAARHSL